MHHQKRKQEGEFTGGVSPLKGGGQVTGCVLYWEDVGKQHTAKQQTEQKTDCQNRQTKKDT